MGMSRIFVWAFLFLCFSSLQAVGGVLQPDQHQAAVSISDARQGLSFFRSAVEDAPYKGGEFLILQSSDQHSAYHKIPDFLGSIEILSRQFKEKNPKGRVILIFNGDFSARDSHWSIQVPEDRGHFGYHVLSRLAEKYSVFYVFGNHDAFDWNDSQLFLDQMQNLKRAGVHLLTANVSVYPEYKGLFAPFVDVPIPSKKGQVLRFAGFTIIKDRDKRLNLEGPKVLSDIYDINQSLPVIINSANGDPQVEGLIPILHLGARKTEEMISRWNDKEREKLRVVFSAHDHRQVLIWTKGIYVIDSDSHFKFSSVVLDSSGRFVSMDFFNAKGQKQLLHRFSLDRGSLEARLIRDVRAWLNQFPPLKKRKKRSKAYRNRKFRASSAVSLEQKGNPSPSSRDLPAVRSPEEGARQEASCREAVVRAPIALP